MGEIKKEKPDSVQITSELLADLKAKAKAATPGPWSEFCGNSVIKNNEIGRLIIAAHTKSVNDARYIAAASPDVVLAMASEIERLRAENKRLLVEAHDLDSSGGEMAKDCRRLEKEADWLAEQLLACTDDNRIDTCRYTECGLCSDIDTVAGWRKSARKAVEAKSDLFDRLAEHPDTKLAPEG